jgi:hypothetical protein
MREAKLILPVYDNRGISLVNVHEALHAKLAHHFKGYTATTADGGWKGGSEPVIVYTIAMRNTSRNNERLYDIAEWLVEQAQQDAIYVKHPDGTVQLVTEAR